MRLIDADVLNEKLQALVERYAEQGRFEVAKDYSFVQSVLLTAATIYAEPVKHGRWIDIKERMPELGERVLCTDGYCVFEQYRVELSCVYGIWDRGGIKSPLQDVTHWMPLPKPPEVEV